jgi:hypothetical protein
MEILEEVANDLKVDREMLARNSLKFFLSKELSSTEAEMFKIATRHGIESVLEFDELLRGGKVKEEDIIDDFMEFDYLEARRGELLKVIGKLR